MIVRGPAGAPAVWLTVQVARLGWPATTASEQLVGLNEPGPVELKLTVPVGLVATALVLVTVARQVVVCPRITLAGLQATSVVVGNGDAVTVAVPGPPTANVGLPEYEARRVLAPGAAEVNVTWQVARPSADSASVQLGAENTPLSAPPLALNAKKLIMPVGVVSVPPPRSVTLAVQVVVPSPAIVAGVHCRVVSLSGARRRRWPTTAQGGVGCLAR